MTTPVTTIPIIPAFDFIGHYPKVINPLENVLCDLNKDAQAAIAEARQSG